MALLEGIAVSGEYVENLKDKTFTIIKAPHYEEVTDLDKPEEKRRRLVMTIRLADGSELTYYPNKTSQKTMANLWGYQMDNWISKKFEWLTIKQKVMGDMKTVLFVAEKRLKVNGKGK